VQRRNDAQNCPVAIAMRPCADDAMAGAVGQCVVIGKATLDGLAGKRAPVQIAKDRSALRIYLIMAPADQLLADNAKSVKPAIVCRDIAQIRVEQCDRGRDIGDKPRNPFWNGGFQIGASLWCNDDCWWFQTLERSLLPGTLKESEQFPFR
jgi:hypothetical protein